MHLRSGAKHDLRQPPVIRPGKTVPVFPNHLFEKIIRHEKYHNTPSFFPFPFGDMRAFFYENTNALCQFPGLVVFVKDPPAADDVGNKIVFNIEAFFSVCLRAIVVCKQQIPAGQLFEQAGIIL